MTQVVKRSTPFDWSEYFTVGEALLRSGQTEGELRSAVSRVYYYIFHLAKQYVAAVDSGYSDPKENAHKSLVDWYEGKGYKKISKKLHRLRAYRVQADYNEGVGGSVGWARIAHKSSIELRDAIIGLQESCISSSSPSP